jgi:hypothetical protein
MITQILYDINVVTATHIPQRKYTSDSILFMADIQTNFFDVPKISTPEHIVMLCMSGVLRNRKSSSIIVKQVSGVPSELIITSLRYIWNEMRLKSTE